MTVINQIRWQQKCAGCSWSSDKVDLEDFIDEYGWDADHWGGLSHDQKMRVKSHFLVTVGTDRNPPDAFGQLKLPVVSPDGRLHKNALDNVDAVLNGARGGVDGVRGEKQRLQSKVDRLQDKF